MLGHVEEKLAKKIIRGKLKIATDNDLKIYYDNNQKVFNTATKVSVIQYTSKSKKELISILKNPMQESDKVLKSPIVLEQSKLNSQLRFLLNDTEINQFTPIFTANKQFVSLLVAKKEGVSTLSFEKVKQRIFISINIGSGNVSNLH